MGEDKGEFKFKFGFWMLIPAAALIMAACWLSGLGDGTSLLK